MKVIGPLEQRPPFISFEIIPPELAEAAARADASPVVQLMEKVKW